MTFTVCISFKAPSSLYLLVWVIVTLGINTTPAKSDSIETYLTASNKNNAAYHLTKRDSEVESNQDPVSEDKLDDDQQIPDLLEHVNHDGDFNKNISFQEYDGDSSTEQTKLKQNNKQKYVTSDFKNHSSNKFNVDSKHLLLNDSSNDKAKLYNSQGGYVSKYISPDKKGPKLNSTQSDYILKAKNSNSSLLSHHASDNNNSSTVTEMQVEPTSTKAVDKSERLNITHELSDQPVGTNNDNPPNTTDLAAADDDDDDSLDISIRNMTNLQSDRNSSTSADGRIMPASGPVNVLVISGIILGSVALIGLMAGGGFAVYRHRIWNKPQTLSDKCSNADSSGYIDDSTLRENSEEMYSLDNDSFLNSLEAMTIQNYWTDNVKHTKL